MVDASELNEPAVPLSEEVNERFNPAALSRAKDRLGLPGKIVGAIADAFDDPLPDAFWLSPDAAPSICPPDDTTP